MNHWNLLGVRHSQIITDNPSIDIFRSIFMILFALRIWIVLDKTRPLCILSLLDTVWNLRENPHQINLMIEISMLLWVGRFSLQGILLFGGLKVLILWYNAFCKRKFEMRGLCVFWESIMYSVVLLRKS